MGKLTSIQTRVCPCLPEKTTMKHIGIFLELTVLLIAFNFHNHGISIAASWIEEYNCDKGIYEALTKITRECRVSFYMPQMKELRKSQTRVSGKDVVDRMEDYCALHKNVSDCVEAILPFVSCLERHVENFQTMIRRSDWYCSDNKLRGSVKTIYDKLPTEPLNYKTNKCYGLVPTAAYSCVRHSLQKFDGRRNRKGAVNRMANSFRCTYRKMARKCPHQRALLLTTIEYDWMIVPPPLGVNISDAIFRAYRRHL